MKSSDKQRKKNRNEPKGKREAMDCGKQGLEERRGHLFKVLPDGIQNRKLGDVALHKLEQELADVGDRRKAKGAAEGI